MKDSYNVKVSLICITCGDSDFHYNDDKSYIKCNVCNREYLNGYNELVELNQGKIDQAVIDTKKQITNDAKEYISNSLKKTFAENKFIKFK